MTKVESPVDKYNPKVGGRNEVRTSAISILSSRFPGHIMDNELLTCLLLAACAGVFGIVAALRALRRKETPARRRHVDRVASRPTAPRVPLPEQDPEPVPEPPVLQVGPARPSMLAMEGDGTTGLFVQRALEIEESHWRTLPVESDALEAVTSVFARCALLDKSADDGLSDLIYALAFAPVPEAASDAPLRLIAHADGVPMGEVLTLEGATAGLIVSLRTLCERTGTHPLDGLLSDELERVRALMPRVKLLASAVQGEAWEGRVAELATLVDDVRRGGTSAATGERIEAFARTIHEANRRIDESLATLEKNITTPEEADVALTGCISHMLERELAVHVLRTLAIARIVSGDSYIHGMHCSALIARTVERFPDVHALLDKARRIVYDALEVQGRAMSAPAMDLAGLVKRDADRLGEAHDEAVARLSEDVVRLQTAIDRQLLLEGRPRRYAVRLAPDMRLEALMVLEH